MSEKEETAAKSAKKKTTKKKTAKKAVKKKATKKAAPAAKPAAKKTAVKKVAKKMKKAVAADAPTGGRLRVRQVRSTIRRQKTFLATLRALGIHHHQDEVVVTDNASTRGMLRKVRHLVTVTPEG